MWFQGSIRDAIKRSKEEQKIFMVYVEGNDKVSKEMGSVFDSLPDDVSSLIKEEMVSIKIAADSENSRQFSQIYPVVVIPSTYFIGKNGVPLEIIGGAVSINDFVSKINKVLNLQNPSRQEKLQTASASGAASQQISDSDSKEDKSKRANDGGANIPQAVALEDKVKKAQMLVEEIKAKKEREEREKEKDREKERIRSGKELQKTKKLKEELEMQELMREREKDRREEKLARERVLAQIAADREERRLRFTQTAPESRGETTNACQWRPSAASSSKMARIQLKFPDGASNVAQFEPDVALDSVRQYIVKQFNYSRFTLSTPYPKRVFVDSDYRSTLRDLGLVPTSVLLVVPSSIAGSGPMVPISWFSQLFTLLLAPVLLVWSFVRRLLFGEAAGAPPKPKSENPGRTPRGAVAREGNIARLKRKDDDENNTWNGNSTQQM